MKTLTLSHFRRSRDGFLLAYPNSVASYNQSMNLEDDHVS